MLKFKRMSAALIDFFLIMFSLCIPLKLLDFSMYGKVLINSKEGIIFLYLFFLILFILAFFLMSLKDSIFCNRSVGKIIFKLIIIDNDAHEVNNKKVLIKRNLISLIVYPLYPILILFFNKSLGDYKYNTSVVETKKL